MELRVTLSTNLPTQLGRRAKQAVREAARSAAAFWHERFLPKHFQTGAATKYGYMPRGSAYVRRAKRRNPGWRPLVATGQTQSSVQSSAKITATSTKGAKVLMRAAYPGSSGSLKTKRSGFLSNAQMNVLRLNAEITAITADEIERLAKVEEQTFARLMTTPGPIRRLI